MRPRTVTVRVEGMERLRGDSGPGVADTGIVPVRGEMFGPYRLEGLIGQGGMGEVHRAFDVERNRLVALKRMPRRLGSDPEFRARFAAEAQIAARMRNPHVIPIHDYGQIDDQLYIDMRLVDGVDLKSRLEVEGALAPERAVAIVAQVASALDAAHAEGLVHRDVKPSNVLTADGDFVYLIDFGLARNMSASRVTATGVAMGTLAYMAPERFAGPGDHRVDVYALACILHEALTGSAPFPAEDFLAVMGAHITAPPPRPSAFRRDVPAGMDAVVARGMHKDPAQRYARAGDLAAAAKAALAEGAARPPAGGDGRPRAATGPSRPTAPPGRPPAPAPRPGPRRGRTPVLVKWAAVGLAALLALPVVGVVIDELADSGVTAGPYDARTGQEPDGDLRRAVVLGAVGVGASPRNLALTADGSRLYATNRDDDSVSVVDTADNAVVDTVQLAEGDGPEGISLTPDGTTAFVVNNGSSTIAVVDTATGDPRRAIPVSPSPTDVVAGPSGFAYVTTTDGGSLEELDTADVTRAMSAARPQSLALSTDGSLALVTDGGTGTLKVVDTTDFRVIDEIGVGTAPDGVALADDEETAYVVNIDDGTVSVVDLVEGAVVSTIPVGARPISIALHPDGDTAYVTNNDANTVSVIDTATNRVTQTLDVGLWPEAVAVAPDGSRAYVANAGDSTLSIIDTARD